MFFWCFLRMGPDWAADAANILAYDHHLFGLMWLQLCKIHPAGQRMRPASLVALALFLRGSLKVVCQHI